MYPGHKATVGAPLTAIVGIATLGLTLEDGAAALGAAARHFLHDGLGILALGEAGTGQEFTETADLDHHVPPAFLADLLGYFVGYFQPDTLQCCFRIGHFPMETLVKICQNGMPLAFACLHIVQLGFHVGGKLHIDDVLEMIHHKAGDHLAQGRGCQAFFHLVDILPVLDGGDDGGIGGGAA